MSQLISYPDATDEIFGLLVSAWQDNALNALESVLGVGKGYVPDLRFLGDVVSASPNVRLIWAKAQYQTVRDGQVSFRNGQLQKKYESVGMLGVQVYSPINVLNAYRAAKLLARIVQATYRNPLGGTVQYSDERIIEVGATQNYNQFNVFVTCRFETVEDGTLIGGNSAPVFQPSSSITFPATTVTSIIAFRAVSIDVTDNAVYASATTGVPAIGIAATSSVSNGVTIQSSGEMENIAWNWNVGSNVFLDANGALTQAVPAKPNDLISQRVGIAVKPTAILVNIQPAIILV